MYDGPWEQTKHHGKLAPGGIGREARGFSFFFFAEVSSHGETEAAGSERFERRILAWILRTERSTHTQRRRAELRHGMGLVDKADSAISSGQDDQVA